MIRVLVADDHKVFRDGIISILHDTPDIEVAGEAGSGREVVQKVREREPDVIIMDISMGDTSGIATTKAIREAHPNVQVLILSMHSDSAYIMKALEAGAAGYLLKESGSSELINAIRTVAGGGAYYSAQVSKLMVNHLTHGTRPREDRTQQLVPLTPREIEVLRLIAEEYSNPEIAEKLFISLRTVDTHRRNLVEKLGVKNTAGLVKYAIKHNLI